MNVQNMRTWLDALRSGEYSQATGYLGVADGDKVANCCLGVASVLAGCETGAVLRNGTAVVTYDERIDTLPERAREWLGVRDNNPGIDWPDRLDRSLRQQVDERTWMFSGITSAAELNDEGFTFSQIADIIDYFGLVP